MKKKENGVNNEMAADRVKLFSIGPTSDKLRPIVLSTLGKPIGDHDRKCFLDRPHWIIQKMFTRRPQEEHIQEYAVDLVDHIGQGDDRKHIIGWYGYTNAEDTAELQSHVTQNFMQRY